MHVFDDPVGDFLGIRFSQRQQQATELVVFQGFGLRFGINLFG